MLGRIEIHDLVKEYRARGGKQVRAVDGISLEVAPGEILGFLGPNGAGKTTTIKMTCGLILPDSGSIRVSGLDIVRQRRHALSHLGAVLEGNRNIYWHLPVSENMRYFGRLKLVPKLQLEYKTQELLEFFDLWDWRDAMAQQLSRGMQQKLAIACALVHDPEILLLDEPTLGLDVQAARLVKQRVQDLARRQGRTVVLTTHQLDVAQALCDRVAIVSHGRIVAQDRVENLLGLFSRQEYDFRLAESLPSPVWPLLSRFGSLLSEQKNSGDPGFRILLRDSVDLYAVMGALEGAGVTVRAVNKKEADLEQVFVAYTEVSRHAS